MKTENPLVTVLMPVYNGEKFLREAIESILDQTCSDFEFLIIDDGSSDQSREIVCCYDNSRILLFENGNNRRLERALNRGGLCLEKRLELYYTPKHDSWLNITEIERNVLTKHYSNRRINVLEKGQAETKAWTHNPNNKNKKLTGNLRPVTHVLS